MNTIVEPASLRDTALGQIVATDWRKASVLKKYRLDFCCGGKKTLNEVCTQKGLDVDQVERELLGAFTNAATRPLNYGEWTLTFLSDYIINTHHNYVRKMLPEILAYASKVARVHGEEHPELNTVRQLFEDISKELSAHMIEEEHEVFPSIKYLEQKNRNSTTLTAITGRIQTAIDAMEEEHEAVGSKLEKISSVTDNYTLPQDACGSYKLLFDMLQDFETDLHLHIHLENNILFPQALKTAAPDSINYSVI